MELSIGKVVDILDKKGKKPGSPTYFKAVQDEILFHFEIEEKDLSDSEKFENKAKGIAKKCKELLGKAQTVKKMFDVNLNKVRLKKHYYYFFVIFRWFKKILKIFLVKSKLQT